MAKKYFAFPYVLLTRGHDDNPGDDVNPFFGSGTGTPEDGEVPTPCNFSGWLQLFACHMDDDSDIDREDYRLWWLHNNLSAEAWNEYNPGIDLNQPYPGCNP